MSTDLFRRYGNLLSSDGTNQGQRLLPALEADHIVPDERTLSDLVDYLYRVAAEVRYYELSGQASGDWRALFQGLLVPGTDRMRSTDDLQLLLASRADWPPHLALCMVFLKLYQLLQADLNQITHKHLLHYDENELGLQRRGSAPDQVHVLFELAPNAAPALLPAGTLLDAGKDAQGRVLAYALQNDIVVHRAAIGGLRRQVVETDVRHQRRIFAADNFGPGEGPSWHTFGRRQLDLATADRFMREAAVGFIVATPVLAMAEGERTVTLRAHLRSTAGPAAAAAVATQGVASGLVVALSGDKGWLVADSVNATLLADGGLGQPALLITARVAASAPAVVPLDPALHGSGLAGAPPALRCLMTGESGLLDVFDGLRVERVQVDVAVRGVRQLLVQNDDAVLASGAPVPLFGSQPRLGSAFYIGSAEIFGKKLTGLDMHFAWKSPPANLFEHYRAYLDNTGNGLSDVFHTLFKADVALLYEREFRPIFSGVDLFQSTPAAPNTLSADTSAFRSALAGLDDRDHPELIQPQRFDGSSRFGFLRLQLSKPDSASTAGWAVEVPFEAFGHGNFAARYTLQAIALSQWVSPAPKPLLPKEPYTPVLASLSFDYQATADLQPGVGADVATPTSAQFFAVGPFGVRRARSPAQARLLPQVDGGAALFIGIGALAAPANVALFFDIAVGTATAAPVLQRGDTQWSVLDASDNWLPLAASAVLGDGTQGFQQPGVVALTLPVQAALAHTSMPAGLLWLRAAITKPPGSAARTVSLRTQGALATFTPGALSLSAFDAQLRTGLPAHSITRLSKPNAAIRRVDQPGRSFGGQGTEDESAFVQRASERLRHRHRAVTSWDVEHLVLDRFPAVFKVKCLPHTDDQGAARAGHAAVVVVPNLRNEAASNRLEPRAGEVLLADIREHLAGLASPFATLHVIRPVFERLRVETKVVFTRGSDPGWCAGLLNVELCRFLSPWAFQDGEDILFGARIYRSDILAFIEGRSYVDHLVGLHLFHQYAGDPHDGLGWMRVGTDFIVRAKPQPAMRAMRISDDFIVGRPVDVAQTTQAHAILVSHPQHLITPVAAGAEVCAGVTRLGIGYMTVGLDFDVVSTEPA